jgi:hypothetical protein
MGGRSVSVVARTVRERWQLWRSMCSRRCLPRLPYLVVSHWARVPIAPPCFSVQLRFKRVKSPQVLAHGCLTAGRCSDSLAGSCCPPTATVADAGHPPPPRTTGRHWPGYQGPVGAAVGWRCCPSRSVWEYQPVNSHLPAGHLPVVGAGEHLPSAEGGAVWDGVPAAS